MALTRTPYPIPLGEGGGEIFSGGISAQRISVYNGIQLQFLDCLRDSGVVVGTVCLCLCACSMFVILRENALSCRRKALTMDRQCI